jgi:NADH-quinone oxidoreductase subunit A
LGWHGFLVPAHPTLTVPTFPSRLSIEFYLIAMFFVIFDLETIFIFAWAVAFYELGWQGYLGAAVFIVVLLVALVYEWRTGALDWGVLRRRPRREYSIAADGST